jgi:hypothetical protein
VRLRAGRGRRAVARLWRPGCSGELTKSEHALAFLLFDLAACIQHDTTPPMPPPVVVD